MSRLTTRLSSAQFAATLAESEEGDGGVGLARVVADLDVELPLRRDASGEHGDELGVVGDRGYVPRTATPAEGAGAVARRDAGRCVVVGRRIAVGG